MKLLAGSFGHEPIGNTSWKFSRDRIIHAIPRPTAGDMVPLIDFGQQRWDVGGIMLQISIERNNHVALGLMEA